MKSVQNAKLKKKPAIDNVSAKTNLELKDLVDHVVVQEKSAPETEGQWSVIDTETSYASRAQEALRARVRAESQILQWSVLEALPIIELMRLAELESARNSSEHPQQVAFHVPRNTVECP